MTSLFLSFLNTLFHFNSHPHEEDDHGRVEAGRNTMYFNSHPHEEDDESYINETWTECIFQLTSSRGG